MKKLMILISLLLMTLFVTIDVNGEPCEGESDHSFIVDNSILVTFAANFGESTFRTGLADEGDLDVDADIDGYDLALLIGDDSIQPTSEGKVLSSLSPVNNCDQLLVNLKERAIQEMEENIRAYMKEVLKWGSFCYPHRYLYMDYDAVLGGVPNSNSAGPAQDSASEYSQTNNQVEGVDEADFIKNDGSFIYILANGKFMIIDAWPPEDAYIVNSVDIEGTPKKLFISSNRALIYSSLDYIGSSSPYPEYYNSFGYSNKECTHGYDCDFTGDNRKLKITIYDISDRYNPVLLREIRFSGSYINSRKIGTAVHSVILFPPVSLPSIVYQPELLENCLQYEMIPTEKEIIEAFEDLIEKNRLLIKNTSTADWLPSAQDTLYVEGKAITNDSLLLDCTDFYVSKRPTGRSFLTVLSLDLSQTEELNQTTVLGRPGAVYSSSSALYVSARQEYNILHPWYYKDARCIREASTVHKFKLNNDSPDSQYIGSGVVKGRVLNQFAMDEFKNHLRIATTTGHVPNPNAHSTVSILREKYGELKVVGQVDDIAPSEDIRSVRFNNERAFIVTFKKTDPLFVLNLASPTAPIIEGELKIPGYSTYMHLMDEKHLLSIGYDADEQGDFAWFQGIMLQVFDVSEMSNPTLLHKEVVGTRGSSSEAATNHLAFNYFAPKDLLSIPMTICEGGSGGGSYGTEMTFSGLLVYEITVEDGFIKLGGVSHVVPGSENSTNACSNWWTNSNSVVKRSIFMDNYVFSVALDKIKIANLDDLYQDVSVMNFERE